jgi:glycine cleavage system H protein
MRRNDKETCMKPISEMTFPEELRYSEDHEWAVKADTTVKVGITDYAQDQLGDIVYVELPQVGDTFSKGEEFGTIESVKAVSQLLIPMSGEVVAINEELEDAPEQVGSAPYDTGWLIEMRPTDPSEFNALMDRQQYIDSLKA